MVYFSWDDKPEAFDDDKELLKLKIYRDEDKNQIVPIQLTPVDFEQLLHSQQLLLLSRYACHFRPLPLVIFRTCPYGGRSPFRGCRPHIHNRYRSLASL